MFVCGRIPRDASKRAQSTISGVQGSRTFLLPLRSLVDGAGEMLASHEQAEVDVNNIIYIVGLVVVVIAVLSFFGLR